MLAVTEVQVETIVVGNSSSGKVLNACVLCVQAFAVPLLAVLSYCDMLGKTIHWVVSSIAITN